LEPIGVLRAGRLVRTLSPAERERLGWATIPAPVRENLRLVQLSLGDDEDGVDIELLRPERWLRQCGACEAAVVWLDLPEMGAQGWAKVVSVGPCPELEEGEGGRVTGRSSTIGSCVRPPTRRRAGGHRRDGPTPVLERGPGGLGGGARLAAGGACPDVGEGTAVVESLDLSGRVEPVYNIEVEGDHCYRVGQQGVLVHKYESRL